MADLDMGGILSSTDPGARWFTVGNAAKYISRYLAPSGEKRDNPRDLLKAIHYLLFELRRRTLTAEELDRKLKSFRELSDDERAQALRNTFSKQVDPRANPDDLADALRFSVPEYRAKVRGQLAEDLGDSQDYPGPSCDCAECSRPPEARPELDPLPFVPAGMSPAAEAGLKARAALGDGFAEMDEEDDQDDFEPVDAPHLSPGAEGRTE